MRIVRMCFLLCGFAAASVVMAEDAGTSTPATVANSGAPVDASSETSSNTVTINGTTYKDVRWGRLTPSTVTLYHSTGIATMPLAELPPDLQKQFGYDPEKAAAWDASVQKTTAARQAAEAQADQARKAEDQKAAAKAEADKQKALAANSAHTNAPPQKTQQASQPAVGNTLSAIKQKIRRSY